MTDEGVIEYRLPDEAATARLGADLAAVLVPGDLVALQGEVGAGKSTLARAMLRALHRDPTLDVPSPTFTLAVDYPNGRLPALHVDLYRIASPAEADELGIDEALECGVVLVEWPEKGDIAASITVSLSETDGGESRVAWIEAVPAARARIERSLAIRAFLARAGHGDATRDPMAGDASARGYETIETSAGTLLLMDSPAMPDGPPVRGTLPYSRVAHLAENVRPFVAVATALRSNGLHAPAIVAADFDAGLLLTEHLGCGSILHADGRPNRERYLAVAEALATIHDRRWPAEFPLEGAPPHRVPEFDRGAMTIEVELTLDWAFPRLVGRRADEGERAEFHSAWDEAFDGLRGVETSLVLRDVQAPNIVWQHGREGLDRVGLIDFQDALVGPAAYDVASLAQDARVTIPPDLEAELKSHYSSARAAVDPRFERAYAIMAAQRATKVFGLWVRLDERDGKPQYLCHAPRTRAYLGRVLHDPALAAVRAWFEKHDLLARSERLERAA